MKLCAGLDLWRRANPLPHYAVAPLPDAGNAGEWRGPDHIFEGIAPKPLPGAENWSLFALQNSDFPNITTTKQEDQAMPERMTRQQALLKAKQLLGPTAMVLMDQQPSSNKIRREASTQRGQLVFTLKRFDLTPDRRQAVQQSLAECRKLKKYFRFKIGTVTKEFRPFKIFVLVAHADSWEQCFAKIAKRTRLRPAPKKRRGSAGATGKA